MAIEDRRFYSHFGVDPIGLARALVTNAITGHTVQGGSTLTQQLAKNLFLSPERTLERKVQEVLLAFWLEHKYTKDQILAMYLNRVFFGSNAFGVEAASRRYFSKSARDVNACRSGDARGPCEGAVAAVAGARSAGSTGPCPGRAAGNARSGLYQRRRDQDGDVAAADPRQELLERR